MARPVRRVVTGHRKDGRSTVLADGPAPNVKQRAAGNASTLLWVTEESPSEVFGVSDRAAREIGVPPPPRGHPPRHPAIHRTRTIDYVIVLEGEIDLLLDDGEVRLAAGDVVVQRGTNHAWLNRSDGVCRLGMVFVDALEPPELAARR